MQGQLFTQDFLHRGIRDTPPWLALSDAALADFSAALHALYAPVSSQSALNEAQTEQLLIHPVLAQLGWGDDTLAQVNLSGKRREDVPDLLLFPHPAAKAAAIAEPKDDRRIRHGLAILEAKRWLKPLDRGNPEEPQDPDAPSSQMLRYLSRVDVVADRRVKWGILSNGAVWRLYWQDARSRAEEFFEIELAAALAVPGVAASASSFDEPAPAHAIKLFFLFFSRAAFLTQTWDSEGRSFHAYARMESRHYEEKVSQDLGQRVFLEVFPQLAQALAKGDLESRKQPTGYGSYTRSQYTAAYLDEVREATLILLYRLLFLFYAEDRLLLPARDARYAPYSVRGLRQRVRDGIDAGQVYSSRLDNIWRDLKGAFLLIDEGDDAVGMPAYNGGLFERARSLLLERSRIPDAVLAPIIDALSRRTEDLLRGWINYRDLSVSHLGGIYERLLEYSLVHEVQAAESYHDRPEIDRIHARPASFARKVSGSYYTHDDLVRLILRESVGLLADERIHQFEAQIKSWQNRATLTPPLWDKLDGQLEAGQRDAIDPATRILELTVCDPAMGSGHFLVALVDDLADRVLEAVSRATDLVNRQPWAAHLVQRGRAWQSPVIVRIAHIRASIRAQATEHGWAVTEAQLDDRHIVRRMILKKSIFGVDKNPMAVELAKTALWLHTFTVGAPLSFLDHHLKLGDSLHGERLPAVRADLSSLGMLFNQDELDRLGLAARGLAQVADLTDVDIAEARESKRLATEADARTAPLHALLDFWRALRWRLPGWPVADARKLGKLGSADDKAIRDALAELFSPGRNLVALLHQGTLSGNDAGVAEANALMAECRALARREDFFHWWTAFPTVFAADGRGGFDVVLGNPPWDRIKLQQVEWFAEREPDIANQPRAADRKRLITALEKKKSPLWADYQTAVQRAEAQARVLAKSGDFPLLGGGDVNLYSLFVERALSLVRPDGLVALLTPSGIAADKGAAEFFKSISATGRLGALFDFENKKVFFADVHASFKFCTLVFGGPERQFAQTRCAFYLHSLAELDAGQSLLVLSKDDFQLVNPNTGAAPIFRSRRDADITLQLYRENPVLAKHGGNSETQGALPSHKVWSVKYATMFHMTNDSRHFIKPEELVAQGWQPAAQGRWRLGDAEALPLYEGKMVQLYDHRAADVVLNLANLKRAAQQESLTAEEKTNPNRLPEAQYFVSAHEVAKVWAGSWVIAYKSVTAPSNMRTMISAILPRGGVGNSMAMLLPMPGGEDEYSTWAPLLLANLNSMAFDFVLRQKVQGQNLNWFIVEQASVITPQRFEQTIGGVAIADFIREQVLHLSYTAHDLAPFARDLGWVDGQGQVKPPFVWHAEDRRQRLAALDGLFCHLYGLSDADAAHVLASFAIVREQDIAAFGRFRTQDDVLAQLRAIRSGRLVVGAG